MSDNDNLEEILMKSLIEFYSKDDNIHKFLNIVGYSNNDEDLDNSINFELNSKNKNFISRRILDWFVTNYSKRNKIVYDLGDPKFNPDASSNRKYKPFSVNDDYKCQLRSFQKKYFDPFCRNKRIKFYYDTKKYKRTTIGQLNFFRWVINNKIIDYILDNINDIENDMNNHSKNNSTTIKLKNKRNKNKITATRSTNKLYSKIIVNFNSDSDSD